MYAMFRPESHSRVNGSVNGVGSCSRVNGSVNGVGSCSRAPHAALPPLTCHQTHTKFLSIRPECQDLRPDQSMGTCDRITVRGPATGSECGDLPPGGNVATRHRHTRDVSSCRPR
eukprot:199304-Chlamydomonas_euryale.AAC.2